MKKGGSRSPYWYSLFGGPRNLEKWADRLEFNGLYHVLYRQWSSATHGMDIVRGKTASRGQGQAGILQPRLPSDAQVLTVIAVTDEEEFSQQLAHMQMLVRAVAWCLARYVNATIIYCKRRQMKATIVLLLLCAFSVDAQTHRLALSLGMTNSAKFVRFEPSVNAGVDYSIVESDYGLGVTCSARWTSMRERLAERTVSGLSLPSNVFLFGVRKEFMLPLKVPQTIYIMWQTGSMSLNGEYSVCVAPSIGYVLDNRFDVRVNYLYRDPVTIFERDVARIDAVFSYNIL